MHGLLVSKVESRGRRGRRKTGWLDVDVYELFPAVNGRLQPTFRPNLLPLLAP